MRSLQPHMRWICCILIVFVPAFYKANQYAQHVPFKTQNTQPNYPTRLASKQNTFLISSEFNMFIHASSLIELQNGDIRAFWYSGTQQGAPDVKIYTAVFNIKKNKWARKKIVTSREITQKGLYRHIKTIGNPIVVRGADNHLHLFYVTVSLGGWGGSSITQIQSFDDGETWSLPQRLITSPFLNISTLVKGAPFLYQDGSIGLPIYHEFIYKFAELLHLNQHGDVIDKQRLSSGNTHTLQPVVLIKNRNNALILMRNADAHSSRRIKLTRTIDRGEHWTKLIDTNIPNHDSALSAVVLKNGRLIAVVNDVEEGRDKLSLVTSNDGVTWKKLYRLEDQRHTIEFINTRPQQDHHIMALLKASDAYFQQLFLPLLKTMVSQIEKEICSEKKCQFEFSYPYLIITSNGDLHLTYTWNRRNIKHRYFSQAWLNQQINRGHYDAHN